MAISVRDRIVEVLAKYNRKLEDAPLDALTMAMERLIEVRSSSLLRPATQPRPLPADPEERARYLREIIDRYPGPKSLA